MEELYHNLRYRLKRTLNGFRNRLLLFDFLNGITFLLLFILVYLLLFYFVISLFYTTVLLKTILFLVFWIGLIFLSLRFILYPVIRFFVSLRLNNDILFKRILKILPAENDIFLSLYNLAFHSNKVTGNEELKEAAFIQKYNFQLQRKKEITFPWKSLFRQLIFLSVLFLIFFVNGRSFYRFYSDLNAYESTNNPRSDVSFRILNKSLNVEYGKSFQLKLDVESQYMTIENIFICYGGGEFLMDKSDSLFIYDFDVINNDIKLYFKAGDIESKLFEIKVLPTPEITDYKVTYIPPKYTGLKSEVLKNVVDFRVLYGSTLKFDLDYSDLDSLFTDDQTKITPVLLKSAASTSFSFVIRQSMELSLLGSNIDFSRKNLLNFTVTCMPDLYPGIEITELQDSLRNSIHYFYGVITDDYGFADLRFNYSVNRHTNTVMPVPIVKNINTQEFYFTFDFAEFAGMDKAEINYYFEVFDNDDVSGPKSTRSDARNYLVPDLNTIFEYNVQADKNVNSSLNEAEKLAKDIVSNVKELQRKMLDNTVDNWEKQQLSKDIVEKKNKLDKLLNTVKEDNLKKSSLNKSFTKQDSVLMDKQKQIQDLLDKVIDDEMKKLMEEFSKLSKEFSKDKFQNLDEKMKLSFDQMSDELDRNIELLKRFQIEEKHDLITKQLDKLKSDQQNFEQLNDDKSVSKDSLASLSEQLKENFENTKNNYQNLLENNKDLSAPYDLKKQDEKFDELSQKIDRQTENSNAGKKDNDLSKDIEEKIDELSNELQQQKQKNFNDMSLPENDIELIIQNILIISLSQEELLKEFSKAESQGSKYIELGRLQDLKRQEYKVVKDSLSLLAKSNLMLASLLSDKFYELEIKFGLLPGYIQDNKRSDLSREQQYIINFLNDIALVLTDALQKSRQESENSKGNKEGKPGDKPGKGKGKSSGDGKEDGYGRMKQMQNGIKKQLEDMVSKMKNGDKGKPLQQGISNMIRENELFRKSLNDYISETGSLSNAEKQLLNEINRLLDENIRDMANYSISGHLINRNNQIYNKLLMSEKASKEREEYEEKRKSEVAREAEFKRPEILFDTKKKSGLIKTDMKKGDIKLNDYFKNMYNNYYIKLGNE